MIRKKYLPVIELLRGYFAIESRDDPRKIREKVTGKVLTLDRALEPTLPGLLALLDVSVDEASWHASSLADLHVRCVFRAQGGSGPSRLTREDRWRSAAPRGSHTV